MSPDQMPTGEYAEPVPVFLRLDIDHKTRHRHYDGPELSVWTVRGDHKRPWLYLRFDEGGHRIVSFEGGGQRGWLRRFQPLFAGLGFRAGVHDVIGVLVTLGWEDATSEWSAEEEDVARALGRHTNRPSTDIDDDMRNIARQALTAAQALHPPF